MQVQIFKKDTKELIAWFDTRDGSVVVNDDYDVKTGRKLHIREGKSSEDYGPFESDGKRRKVYITG